MTEQTPAHQTIVIDSDETVAVFADPTEARPTTRVFYDLDALFGVYAPRIMVRFRAAELAGDERQMLACAGETRLLEGIRQSIEALRLEYEFNKDTATERNIMGFIGDDGTLS